MLDNLYAAGQALCLLGLAWGAWLAVCSSETATALREAGAGHRRRRAHPGRALEREDPHVSSLGYWP